MKKNFTHGEHTERTLLLLTHLTYLNHITLGRTKTKKTVRLILSSVYREDGVTS